LLSKLLLFYGEPFVGELPLSEDANTESNKSEAD
jgi:hypothetical protein